MKHTIIATLIALGLIAAIAAPGLAHRSATTGTIEKPFPPKDFWEQQRRSGS